VACWPKASWSRASTSSLDNKPKVKASIFCKSQPSSNGADKRHHMLMWVYCSLPVNRVGCGWPHPTQPTTSMSGSFQWPGPAKRAHLSWEKPLARMDSQVSTMSPVVRQELANFDSSGAFRNGAELDKLKMTSRPLSRRAPAISSVSGPSFGYQSYLR